MYQNVVDTVLCDHCGAELEVELHTKQCPFCGNPTGLQPAGQQQGRPWQDDPWTILAILFLGVGPLALPKLWQSKAFDKTAKVVLTAVVLVLTALVLGLLYSVVLMCQDVAAKI